jgi:hypothetical protein
MTDEEKKILEMQPPSTRMLLERQAKANAIDDSIWQTRELSQNWKAVPNAKTWEEQVGARKISQQEEFFYNGDPDRKIHGMRQKVGAWIAEREKQKDATSVTPSKWKRAVDAFMDVWIKRLPFSQIMKDAGLTKEKEKVGIPLDPYWEKKKNEK